MHLDLAPWLNGLNEPQRRAATHGDGPLLIVAGAGTGKTRTLTSRVAYLLEQGIQPERILLLTFTRRAAREMVKRAASAAPAGIAVQRVWGGTFHSVANHLLRQYAHTAGLSPDFTILDRSDAEDLLSVVRNDLGYVSAGRRFPQKATCAAIYSRAVNGSERLGRVLERHFPWCAEWEDALRDMFRAYVERKARLSILDYDDLLLHWYYLVQDEDVADLIGGGFDHILVDEYQDTNRLQAGILEGVRHTNRNITVVGDDAQSIYGFRSATVENILSFPRRFAGATVITLEQNYRSTGPVLDTANAVIAGSARRYVKNLWSSREPAGRRPHLVTCTDESQQDEAVVRRILEHHEQGIPLRKQAVLFRAASHSVSLELALTRRNIPFHKYGGLRFLEAAHIKDMVSLLRVCENPRDEIAWFRVLQLLPGVGPAIASSAIERLVQEGYDPGALRSANVPSAVQEGLAALAGLLDDLREANGRGPSVQVERIQRFIAPLVEKNYESPEPRLRDMEHLADLAQDHETLQGFLSGLVLDPPASTGDLAGPPVLDDDWLVLSTIHSAKGLEWDAVYLIHAADGNLPSDMATGSPEEIEEELRLTYVAMTRAKNFLYVLWPVRYYHKPPGVSDNHSYAQRSRFLTNEVVATMEQVVLSPTREHNGTVEKAVKPVDVAAKIRHMWE